MRITGKVHGKASAAQLRGGCLLDATHMGKPGTCSCRQLPEASYGATVVGAAVTASAHGTAVAANLMKLLYS